GQGERGRAGWRVESSEVRARHSQGWPCRERSSVGCTADLERRPHANDSGESPTVDIDDRSDGESDNGTATSGEGTADAEQGTVDDKEGAAEARCAAPRNSGTRIAELHRIAVDVPNLAPRRIPVADALAECLAGHSLTNRRPP